MAEKIFIFDTTLRDGEQSPGAAMNVEEKIQIAHQLARLNVDVIEAGFPISSPGDFEAVSRIAQEVEGPEICGLARAMEEDIIRCWEAVKFARKPRIHTFIGTSDIHIRGQLRKNRDEVLRIAVDSVKLARSLCERVEFSPMDATRTDREYLMDVVRGTIEAGASVINIPDTVGYAMPEEFADLIAYIRERVPDNVIISVHCHDDLGMSTANALAAVRAGARQIECTINALGERAGNTSLEEVVMAIRTRKDFFDEFYTDVNTKEIYATSRLVSRCTGIEVPPNKAIVGANAFAHSSGIHQDGVIKDKRTFEIMNPQDVGVPESRFVLTPRSGRNALRHKLQEMGYEISGSQLDKIYERFLALADKKKQITDADLEAIVRDEFKSIPETYRIESIQVMSGTNLIPTATVTIRKGDELLRDSASGDGPVDAAYKAIDRIVNLKVELEDYVIRAVTSGKDAIGEVTVKVKDGGRTFVGHGASTDVIEASVKAYVDAINKMIYVTGRGA
ncbi:TPA: 2-isopropylmalate synthase [Candidatus Poribacteria bacterium]|nr:2-isopropylmalate synthase [Candidatus Poribacteria bacterium]HEX30793.1 2-isopropylmalate synthase [Candidatus Poribacteria bacterium]